MDIQNLGLGILYSSVFMACLQPGYVESCGVDDESFPDSGPWLGTDIR